MLELRDPSLLAENAYINGVWCGAASNETFEVTNPSTGESLARLPNLGVEDARRAIDGRARTPRRIGQGALQRNAPSSFGSGMN